MGNGPVTLVALAPMFTEAGGQRLADVLDDDGTHATRLTRSKGCSASQSPHVAQRPLLRPAIPATALTRGVHALGSVGQRLAGSTPRASSAAPATSDASSRRTGSPRPSTCAACAPRLPSSRGRRAARPAPAGRRAARLAIRSSCGTTQPASPISLARVGVDALAGEQQLHRVLPVDALRQPDRADDRRHADADLGKAELGALARDHEVAPRHERQPVAEAVAVHRRDHRLEDLPAALERVDGRLLPERARELAGASRRRRVMSAPAQNAVPGAGDDRDPRVLLVAERGRTRR